MTREGIDRGAADSDGSSPGRPLRIGITGPIGCGKSTVAGWLGELGARVIDADQVAREVTPPGSAALEAIVDAFGASVLAPDGSLDRPRLGRIVFANAAALLRLESIVHPFVRRRILTLMSDAEAEAEGGPASNTGPDRTPAIVIEAIKLVEGGLAALCDEVWLVTCDPDAQRQRLAERAAAAGRPTGRGAQADTEARIAAQSGLVASLLPSATRVIDTTGSIAESRSRVETAWRNALAGTPDATNP